MKLYVVLTDDDGTSYEGAVVLRASGGASAAAVSRPAPTPHRAGEPEPGAALDFGLSMPAFAKRYARDLSGAAKFTLLLAKLTDGTVGRAMRRADILREWGKITRLLGQPNAADGNRARENGWVDTPKHGHYSLTADWGGALSVVNGGE